MGFIAAFLPQTNLLCDMVKNQLLFVALFVRFGLNRSSQILLHKSSTTFVFILIIFILSLFVLRVNLLLLRFVLYFFLSFLSIATVADILFLLLLED